MSELKTQLLELAKNLKFFSKWEQRFIADMNRRASSGQDITPKMLEQVGDLVLKLKGDQSPDSIRKLSEV